MKSKYSKILALDVSSSSTGYVVFSNLRWRKAKNSYGSIRIKDKSSLASRLVLFRNELEKLLLKHKPDVIVIEDVFNGRNVATMKLLARFNGVALEVCKRLSGGIIYIPLATTVRAKLGCGKTKQEAFDYICSKYNLDWSFSKMNDITDAICLALYARLKLKEDTHEK